MSLNFRLIRGVLILLVFLPSLGFAQSMRTIKLMSDYKPQVIIDYGNEVNVNTKVPYKLRTNANSRTSEANSVNFSVTYINFTAEQQAAFQFAVDIWADLLQSDVTVNLQATMSPLADGVLGQTTTPARFGNFDNAQKINTLYSVSMAEKIAGHDLNVPGDPDIIMEFSNEFSWYFGTDLDPPSNTFDFVSVILHEIAHGLGFSDGSFVNNGIGFYSGLGAPMVYDRHLETGDNQNVVDTFEDSSEELGDVLTGNDLFFKSFLFPPADRPTLYAPSTYNGGSSIAHLDEAFYPAGDPNSLMSPQFGFGEAIHDPGLALEMFQDMGWVSMNISFDKFLDSEDLVSDRTLTAIIKGDSAIKDQGVNLHYTISDFANEMVLPMTPTGNVDEYSATIPSTITEQTVSYFIDVAAVGGISYSSPGEAPDFFWQYVSAPDTIAPVIEHQPIELAFIHDEVIEIEAEVTDNIGVGDLMLTYKINDGAESIVVVPLVESTSDGEFNGEYRLMWDIVALGVVQGDILEYKLSVNDIAAIPNSATDPAMDFFEIEIEEIEEAVLLYTNDFNSPTSDFIGTGFTIGSETGFDSDALHSDHPYRVIDGVNPDDTVVLTQMLKIPIVLSELEASISYDEVVLIEPGGDGSIFGDDDFWDYVIVEGSNDLGASWLELYVGNDSNDNESWLERWESDQSGNNSTATGDKELFVKRKIDMTANGNFVAGDTILVRFKLYADQLSHGWGWVIDNLKIQVDEEAPSVSQITPDYILVGATELQLKSKVEDNTELDSVIYEVDFNGSIQLLSFPGTTSLFKVDLGFPGINSTDVLKYRIIAVDKAPNPNTSISPKVGFYEVPVANLGETKAIYTNDFNTESDDFIGANFSIDTPDNFTDPAIVSTNPYPDAPFETSEISYLLKYPIKLKQGGAFVQYDEGVLTEPGVDKVSFDVSKDNGATWIPVFEPYDSSDDTIWSNIYSFVDSDSNSTGVGIPDMMTQRFFNILDNPEINGGDEVLVRFRLSVNDRKHGWGWVVDNLEIQGPTTGIEDELSTNIDVYPNPTSTGSIIIEASLSGFNSQIQITDILGKVVYHKMTRISNSNIKERLDVSHLRKGIYVISVSDNTGIFTARVVVE